MSLNFESWYDTRLTCWKPLTRVRSEASHNMADMEGPADGVEQLIHALSRSLNCLAEDNRITRKKAIQEITKDTVGRKPSLEGDVLQGVLREILKPCLKLVSDPVEKCRELSIEFLTRSMKNTSNAAEFLPYIIPVFVQRLGQQDIVEPSEEIRLTMIMLLSELIHLVGKKIGAFVDDMVKILQRTIVDAYPEVKKESCKCAALLAKTTPENFHMQSESLIKPLLTSLTHQHSKVRVAVVEAIGLCCLFASSLPWKHPEHKVMHTALFSFQLRASRRRVHDLLFKNESKSKLLQF